MLKCFKTRGSRLKGNMGSWVLLSLLWIQVGQGAETGQQDARSLTPKDIRSSVGGTVPVIANPAFVDADGDGKPDGWALKTYIIEDFKGVKCLSMKMPRKDKSGFTGEASTAFQGPAGYYRITVKYLDEKDGVSKAKLLVNGKIIRIWNFDGTFGDCWRDEVIENVELKPGDTITFWGRDNPTEYCRIRSISVTPSPVPPTAAEIAERKTPPIIAEKAFGSLVALKDVRDLTAAEDRPDSRPLILGGALVFLSDGKAGLELILNQPRNPKYSLSYLGLEATGSAKGTPLVKESDLPFDPNTGSTVIRPSAGKPGYYAVMAAQGYCSADIPHVLVVGCGEKDTVNARGVGTFYFFVPKGTTAFGVGAYCNGGYTAEVAVNAPDGTLVTRMDVPNDAPQGIPIRVRTGQDDRVWSVNISGVSPKIRLCGVPPYMATHPRYLLVPRECITTGK